jgi:predicted peptidase
MRYLIPLLLLATSLFAARKETGFLDRTVTVDNTTYRYQVYVPANWTKAKLWPVIFFLHGAGERGDDGLASTQVGIGRAIRLHSERFPAVVVMPQCRKEILWTDPKMEAQAMAALANSMKEFHGDPNRIYLTGLSMGGYGTFSLAAHHPSKFAVAVPVCGGVVWPKDMAHGDPYTETAVKIGKTPVWMFHGEADPAVPVTESQKMNAALKAAGGNVRYTEYPGVGHNSWDQT